MTHPVPPGEGVLRSVVVLERVREDFVPDYSVYGMTTCASCNELVYVGHATARVLAEQDVSPLCMECAIKYIPSDTKPYDHVEDGACPKCGGKHGP